MDNGFFTIMAVLGIFMFLFIIIFIASYILLSLGLYSLLKKENFENSKLCWFPIINMYCLGILITDKSKVPKIELFLLYGNIISALIFIFGGNNIYWTGLLLIFCFGTYLLFIYSLYLLYSRYSKESRVLYTVLSIAFVLVAPVFVYSIKDNDSEDIEIEISEATTNLSTDDTNL